MASPGATYMEVSMQPNQFIWNSRTCTGSPLHLAALDGDVDSVRACLAGKTRDGKPTASTPVKERFTYETVFAGKSQEGSGEAIHIAASRGHVEVVKVLLEAKADLTAMVSRDHKSHFDVLHAATFAEGRGGSAEMIDFLMSAKAEMTQNLDNRYPLHIAFLTGNVPVIQLLREHMTHASISEADYQDPNLPSPLMLGIRGGKMSEVQLSESAELTTASLTVFIHECPQCIPYFLRRLQDAKHISALELSKNLTRFDIASVFRESPEAAIALLESTTDVPDCANKGWHPLPSRVSFAPRGWFDRFRNIFNPPRRIFTFYETDHHWAFDSSLFQAPNWHDVLVDRSSGRPIMDAETKVCHIPDLLCAEVFSSLCDTANEESTLLWEDPVVESMISHVFWESGCSRTEFTTVMLTFWGLALYIAEEIYVRSNGSLLEQEDASGRELLRAGAGFRNADNGFNWIRLDTSQKPTNTWLAITWIASKAVVDLFLEFAQFTGFKRIGKWRDYLASDNLRDVFFSVLPLVLLFDHTCLPVMIVAVFLYWFRLLDCFALSEYIGNEILPIKNIAGGLMPAMFVTSIAFGSFTHAFYLVNGSSQNLYPDVFLESFTTLITASLPSTPDEDSSLKLILVLAAVMYFSVFILNIFIGVIGELYVSLKENVGITFKQVRAACCFNFLLRCRSLPCNLCTLRTSSWVMLGSCCVALVTQVYCFINHRYQMWVNAVFLVTQVLIVLSSYQDADSPWAHFQHGPEADHYMWFCRNSTAPPGEEDQAPVVEQATAAEVQGIRQVVDSMKADIASFRTQFDEVKSLLSQLSK
eukprot:TRINITY_DN1058_c0_g1_i1.p1 TRINITY_DN1058_c0_g1~~TRINITY_DN1058_c0_g1_i1.p1  ORF type:complete len:833 (-),score=117.70 TRINITY_DN1058_c0_g1_i1:183-2627(-)